MLSYMNKLLKSLPKDKNNLVLVILLSLFIVIDVQIPKAISKVVDSIVGKSLVILASLSLFGVNSLVEFSDCSWIPFNTAFCSTGRR